MTSQWPVYKEEWNFKENEAEIDAIKEAVRNIRNIRAEMNVAPSKKVHVYVVSETKVFGISLNIPRYSLRHWRMQAR